MSAISEIDSQKRRDKLYSIVAGKYGVTKFNTYDQQEKIIKNSVEGKEKFYDLQTSQINNDLFNNINSRKEKLFNYMDPQQKEQLFNYIDPQQKEQLFNYMDPQQKENFSSCGCYGNQNCPCFKCRRYRQYTSMIDMVIIIISFILIYIMISMLRNK